MKEIFFHFIIEKNKNMIVLVHKNLYKWQNIKLV